MTEPGEGTRTRVAARLPWSEDGLPRPPLLEEFTSRLGARPSPPRSAPVAVRALAGEHVQVVGETEDAYVVLVLDGDRTAARISVTLPGPERLLDALASPDGAALVLVDAAGARTVRALGEDGAVRWERATTADRLLAAPDGVFLPEGSSVTRVGADGVADDAPIPLPRPSPEVFADTQGRLVAFAWDADAEVRLWNRVGAEPLEVRGDDAAWPLLGAPIGVDDTGRAYGRAEQTLGRVGLDGAPDWRVEFGRLGADVQAPSRSSVTAGGEVLIGVRLESELIVVALSGP